MENGTNITRRGAIRLAGAAGKAAVLASLAEKLAWLGPIAAGIGSLELSLPAPAFAASLTRDGASYATGATVAFNKSGGTFSLANASMSLGGSWKYKAHPTFAPSQLVISQTVPLSSIHVGTISLPGSIKLTYPNGASDMDGNTYTATIEVSNIKMVVSQADYDSVMWGVNYYKQPENGGVEVTDIEIVAMQWVGGELYVCAWYYMLPGNHLWGTVGVRTCDVSLRVEGAPAGSKVSVYFMDIDMPEERMQPGWSEDLHVSQSSNLSMSGGWVIGVGTDQKPDTDPRNAFSSVVSADGPIGFKWRGEGCGTALFNSVGFKKESVEAGSEGGKEIKDVDSHLGLIAYYPASMMGSQVAVMVTAAPGTPAESLCGGSQTACDGTTFSGELFEFTDHLGQSNSKVAGSLACGEWHITSNEAEGEDGSAEVSYEGEEDECKSSPVVAHEALASSPYNAARYYESRPDISLGTITGGELNTETGEVEGAGPESFEWSFTGSNANVIKSQWEACLHYMAFCADGVWREIFYEGPQALRQSGSSADSDGNRIVFGCDSSGFTSGGVWQYLPAYDAGASPEYSICPDLNGHVTGSGEWLLNPDATAKAKSAEVRGGACTYLGGSTGSLGNDGWMGWHFTGNSAQPPSQSVLDGWPTSSSHGFIGNEYADVMAASSWSGCHIENVFTSGMASFESSGGVRSNLTSVRLLTGHNYVWGVNHAIASFAWLDPGASGGGRDSIRQNGLTTLSNEIDYTDFGHLVTDQPESDDYLASSRFYDLALPTRLDVRVGHMLSLKQYLGNSFTPFGYAQDATDGETRWTRWRWQGWHLDSKQGKYTSALPRNNRFRKDSVYYTGWMSLDTDGIVSRRVYNF